MNCKFIFLLLSLLIAMSLNAKDIRSVTSLSDSVEIDTPEFLITHEKPFFGLAFIYNIVQPIYLMDDEVIFVDPEGSQDVPKGASHFGWKSRYQLALM